MQKFEGISFVWALIIIGGIALLYGFRAYLGYRAVAKDAEADYTYKFSEGMLDKRLSREGYIRAYKRYNNPRSTAFVGIGMASILLLTVPAMLLIQFIYENVWQLSGQSRMFEPGFLVWQFVLFFSILGIWTTIGYLTARRYHRFAPISLRDEILKELDD